MEEDSLEAVVVEAEAAEAALLGTVEKEEGTAETAEKVKAGTQPITLVSTVVEVQHGTKTMVVLVALAVRTVKPETAEATVLPVVIALTGGINPKEVEEVEELLVQQ